MGLGPIPLSEILAYKEHLDENDDFIDYMMICDSTYMSLYHESQTKPTGKK